MVDYLLRRLLLLIPTIFGILLINFIIVQAAPGGPVERTLANLHGTSVSAAANIRGQTADILETSSDYRGAQGLDPALLSRLEALYGFDKPAPERFWIMLKNYLLFDFGSSFYRDKTVIELLIDKLPVSISLGLWTTLIVYLVSIPLGIAKAQRSNSRFDKYSTIALIIGYAIPAFLLAILLIVLFAGGSYWQWFPLRGLYSDNFAELNWYQQIGDYFWHLTLPVTASVVGSFATLTMFTKNSFLEEMHKQYVLTARAKGLSARATLYRHVFRNAMMLIISGMPAALVGIFFTGSLLIEIIFSLDGLGLLGYEAIVHRDYPIIFATLYIFTLLGLLLKLLSDFSYTLIDPRVDFSKR